MEFSHVPYARVTIRSYLEYDSPESLASAIGTPALPSVPAQAILRWAKGVVFTVSPFQPTDSLVKENIAGHLLWDHVDFAGMPTYRPEIKLAEKPMLTISVIDLSNHPIFGPFAEWIKKSLAKKPMKGQK